jgi:hypothetical protein
MRAYFRSLALSPAGNADALLHVHRNRATLAAKAGTAALAPKALSHVSPLSLPV